MADISILEGNFRVVNPYDNLIYPEVSSCLTITAAFGGSGMRAGGHSVMVPAQNQKTITDICQAVHAYVQAGGVTQVYVVGAQEFWDTNWSDMPQTMGLRNRRVNQVQDLAAYFQANTTFIDTTDFNSVDIYFYSLNYASNPGQLLAVQRDARRRTVVGPQPW